MSIQEHCTPNFSGEGEGSLFTSACSSWTAEEMLRHHHSRSNARYFPIVDPGETSREKIDGVIQNRFEFNHEVHTLSESIPWLENPSDDLEWQILLHKFYFSVGLAVAFHETRDPRYLDTWVRLTSSWIERVQPDYLQGNSPLNNELFVAVTGRRIQNWIYAHYYFVTHEGASDLPPAFHQRFLESIHHQVKYLIGHIAPARNHRTIELYAVFLAATVFPEFEEATDWLEFSRIELFKNMRTDLLSDGVQCELSTDYHHLVLRNYLCMRKLAKLNDIPIPTEIDDLLRKALKFSLHIHKPDGIVPSLSDGDVRSYLELLDQGHWLYGDPEMRYVVTLGREGQPPAERSASFPKSGYYTLRSGWGEHEPYADERYLVFDCGPLGEGNHGHFDLLNIEVAGYGRSLVVDPARYTYSETGDINWRVKFRSTFSHNTVTVDGKNQTRYLPGKRKYKIKGPEPDYEMRACESGTNFDYLHGIARSHEYEAVHERKILFSCREYWIIADLLTAHEEHDYDLKFQLAPEDQGRVARHEAGGTSIVKAPHLVLAHCGEPDIRVAVEEGFVSRRYGEKQSAPEVKYSRRARNTIFFTVLYPYKEESPKILLSRIAVSAENYGGNAALAFSISVERPGSQVTDLCFLAPDNSPRHWHFGDYTFNGHYLLLRQTADNRVSQIYSNQGAILETSSGKPVKVGEIPT